MQLIFVLLYLQLVSFSDLTLLVRHVYKTKDDQTTFPVVLRHYRLSGRKDIQFIKIQWLFQYVSPLWLTKLYLKKVCIYAAWFYECCNELRIYSQTYVYLPYVTNHCRKRQLLSILEKLLKN